MFTASGRRGGRRLRRDPAGERAADPRAGRGGAARKAVAGADGRVPGLGGDDLAEPGAHSRRRWAGWCASATCRTCSATSPRCRRSCARSGSTTPSSGAACRASSTGTACEWRGIDGSTVAASTSRRDTETARTSCSPDASGARGVIEAMRPWFGDDPVLAMCRTEPPGAVAGADGAGGEGERRQPGRADRRADARPGAGDCPRAGASHHVETASCARARARTC